MVLLSKFITVFVSHLYQLAPEPANKSHEKPP